MSGVPEACLDLPEHAQLQLPMFLPERAGKRSPRLSSRGGIKNIIKIQCERQICLFSLEDQIRFYCENIIKSLKNLLNIYWIYCNCPNIVILYLLMYEISQSKKFNEAVKFVPKSKHSYLDLHLPSFLGRYPDLFDFSISMAHMGRLRIGDLVVMTDDDVFEIVQENKYKFELIVDLLDKCGLELNMVTPGWKSPGGLFGPDW